MPEICRFFGIVISMFYDDHDPPHFHATYGGKSAKISVKGLRVLEGKFSKRALRLIKEWAKKNQKKLMEDWELARHGKRPSKIQPLD